MSIVEETDLGRLVFGKPDDDVNIEGSEEEEPKIEEKKQEEFRDYTVEGKWENVIAAYETDKEYHKIKINKRRGTALHVAVHGRNENIVKRLVDAIVKLVNVKALESKNDRGDTPLHLAATRSTSICECIIGKNKERIYLVNIDNQQGETPLFLAVLSCQKQSFAYLCTLLHTQEINIYKNLIRDDGDSILHCAIRAEFFDLAFILICYFPELGNVQNKEGFSPLKLLATRPSAFMSGCKLNWWKKVPYHCLTVETPEVEEEIQYLKKTDEPINNGRPRVPGNSHFKMLRDYVVKFFTHGRSGVKQQSSEKDDHVISIDSASAPSSDSQQHVPPNYASRTWHQFMKFAYMSIVGLSKILGLYSIFNKVISDIRNMKEKHKWGGKLLSALMEKPHESYMGSGGRPHWEDEDKTSLLRFLQAGKDGQAEENEKKVVEVKVGKMETPILTAARNGIVEMVIELRSKLPSALQETTSDKRNILHVAVSNRQTFVVETLKKMLTDVEWENLTQEADNNENTMLHLAAVTLISKEKTWPVPGSAMQMMWDIKWFQYIKQLVPGHFISKTNKDKKTAGEIFKESHEELAKQSSEWLKDTSESCSVVAALIAGVSFATVSTVPGGNHEDTGMPALEGQPGFDTFAIASLIGLCFSVNALIMFLSILTSRKQSNDFRRGLPLKLLLGLSSLFISIVAMFISFCAGHFFVLKDKYQHKMVPLYVATFVPVSFYAIAQFPLYADLLKTILNVPQAVDKGDDE